MEMDRIAFVRYTKDIFTNWNMFIKLSRNDFKKKYADTLDPDVMKYLENNLDHRNEYKGVPINRDGKVRLRDGRTGEYFDAPVTSPYTARGEGPYISNCRVGIAPIKIKKSMPKK